MGNVPPPLTASVAVAVVLSAMIGVGVRVTTTFCVPMPTGVEGVWVAITAGVPDNARAVPVPKTSISLMLGV